MRSPQLWSCLATMCLLVASSSNGFAQDSCSAAAPAATAEADGIEYVEKTICVPEWVTETRTVRVTEYVREQREKTITVCKPVYETKAVQKRCTVYEPRHCTKIVPCTVYRQVWKECTRECVVMVPHQEVRQGTRKVCKRTSVTEMRTVCEDQGHWEQRVVQVSCRRARCCKPCGGCCAGCCTQQVCKKVWVPNIVSKQVPVTVCKSEWVEEPCEYTVTVCKPERQLRKTRVCHYVPETKCKKVTTTTYVPKTCIKTVNVVTCRRVPEQRVVTCTVCVPQQVEKEVTVRVCKMVEKTVKVPVCPPAASGCGSCCKPCAGRCGSGRGCHGCAKQRCGC